LPLEGRVAGSDTSPSFPIYRWLKSTEPDRLVALWVGRGGRGRRMAIRQLERLAAARPPEGPQQCAPTALSDRHAEFADYLEEAMSNCFVGLVAEDFETRAF